MLYICKISNKFNLNQATSVFSYNFVIRRNQLYDHSTVKFYGKGPGGQSHKENCACNVQP